MTSAGENDDYVQHYNWSLDLDMINTGTLNFNPSGHWTASKYAIRGQAEKSKVKDCYKKYQVINFQVVQTISISHLGPHNVSNSFHY
jgi:hypothetical protein